MLPLGQLALYIALGVSIALFVLPLIGIKLRSPHHMAICIDRILFCLFGTSLLD